MLAKPDIDLRIESCFEHLETDDLSLARKLKQKLHHSSDADWQCDEDEEGEGGDTAVVTISADTEQISDALHHQQLQPSQAGVYILRYFNIFLLIKNSHF